RFRVLILGRANAGKTTILERIAGAVMCVSRQTPSHLVGCSPVYHLQRGLHDVKNEIWFPSRPGFVFHDSRGFEAGSSEELDGVRRFVEDSSAATSLREQLHAIW
ncbi:hypothetical protein M422DRAFT_79752, partial [Sphaerobolus stellatus SS14]